jgi:ribosomal protein S18 acetylase RimI-like enzyme
VTEPRRARTDDVPALARVFADAFVADAILEWTVPQDDRAERLRAFFGAFDLVAAEQGWLWTIDGVSGGALWAPPGSETAFEELTFSLDAVQDFMSGPRYEAFWAWAEGRRPSTPHWYLDHLAVDPTQRGRGLGVALVEHGLAMSRARGEPAFLLTSRAGNVPFYERRGFVVDVDLDAPDGGPHVWFMTASP